jgi:hypothetical protein
MAESSGHGGKREGAGRKRLESEKRITISAVFPPDLVVKIDALAKAESKSRSSILVELIRKALGAPLV